ncbi:MAG TPA: Hsp20/alpha crystallin family protein [Candidatus Paceibacterota bacterium]|jgi:HSP20 family protein|nr:Hsp20/alpha crystallin family protein [Parcubacteria group bacterium]HPC37284.1 Hsp20/alpha crystallin family protein [Candidatus Paceibacterota bacterium]HRU35741.1 Hsp20/alpha crystallin family protein [Candidatus Paceibacterota bacterium]
MAFKLFKNKGDVDNVEKNIEVKNSSLSFEEEKEEEDVLSGEGQLMVDVYQTPTEIVIKSTVAGVNSEDIDISIVNDMITIKGRRILDENIKNEDYFFQECYWGSFSRSIILPMEIDSDRISATLKNGILTIRLPKIDKNRVKKIRIKAE